MASNMNSPTDYARALLGKAHDDAYAVRSLGTDATAPDWIIGFHAQQAIEKAIKAVLTKHAVEFPRTHNLSMLVELLRVHAIALPPDADTLARLTPFGAALRYDDGLGEDAPTIAREWAIGIVSRLLDWAANLVD